MVKQWKRSLSGADVQAEAEDALEKDISQMSPASNSVAANLDGGVAAVDWSSKTPQSSSASISVNSTGETPIISVTGSGYLFTAILRHSETADSNVGLRLIIDGTTIRDESVDSDHMRTDTVWNRTTARWFSVDGIYRFDSGFSIAAYQDFSNARGAAGEVFYALD